MLTITVKKEMTFNELLENSWSVAKDVLEEVQRQDREEEVMQQLVMLFEDCYDGEIPDETTINDYIWFELADDIDLYKEDEDDENNDDEDIDEDEEE